MWREGFKGFMSGDEDWMKMVLQRGGGGVEMSHQEYLPDPYRLAHFGGKFILFKS